jgi:hypothetical protein
MLLDGLLGGIAGGSNAVNQLSEERRKALAEQVKMEALEAMEMRMQERKFGNEKEMQGIKKEDEKELMGVDYGHRKDVLGVENEYRTGQIGLEHLNTLERDKSKHGYDTQLLDREWMHRDSHELTKAKAEGATDGLLKPKDAHDQIRKVYDQAIKEGKWKEGKKLPEHTLQQINEIRQAAGMKPLTGKDVRTPGTIYGTNPYWSYSDQEEGEEKGGAEKGVKTEKETPPGIPWQQFNPEDPTDPNLPQTQTNGSAYFLSPTEGAEHPVSKDINRLYRKSGESYSEWNKRRRAAAARVPKSTIGGK